MVRTGRTTACRRCAATSRSCPRSSTRCMRASGAASLRYAPCTSNTGRRIPYVVIGNGPTAVMIIAQQHGDEMETSDSAINLVRTLVNNSKGSKAIRDALTVIVVPRVNVDGFDGEKPDGTPITNATGTQIPPWRRELRPALHRQPAARVLCARPRLRHQPLPPVPARVPVRQSQLSEHHDRRHRAARRWTSTARARTRWRRFSSATRCPKRRTSAG